MDSFVCLDSASSLHLSGGSTIGRVIVKIGLTTVSLCLLIAAINPIGIKCLLDILCLNTCWDSCFRLTKEDQSEVKITRY